MWFLVAIGAIMFAFLCWLIWAGVMAVLDCWDRSMDFVATAIVSGFAYSWSLLVLIAVVCLISMWAKRHAPVPTLRIRNQKLALPRQGNVSRLPDMRVVPMPMVNVKEKQHG
jgi:hypothetical protein